MDFINVSDFNKISKYVIRLRKSVEKNDKKKINDYYEHLKYHIQLGGNPGDNLTDSKLKDMEKRFESIDKVIKMLGTDEGNKFKYGTVKTDLDKSIEEKAALETKLTEVTAKMEEATAALAKQAEETKQIKQLDESKIAKDKELSEQIEKLNSTIEELNKKIIDLTDKNTVSANTIQAFGTKFKEIFDLYDITELDLAKKIDLLKEKSINYKEIINKINEQKDLKETGELEKFKEAIEKFNAKSKEVEKVQTELEELKNQLKDAKDLSVKQEENLKKIESLEAEKDNLQKEITEKNIKIKELEEANNKLQEENKALLADREKVEKELDTFSEEFNKKLRELLESIYGNPQIVSTLMSGEKISDATV